MGSCRRELLDHIIALNERHLFRLIRAYVAYYQGARWVAALVARSTRAALVAGALLLVAFIPQHIMLWDRFPVWYHMTFLLSLVPLTYAGGRIPPVSFSGARKTS